jgi:hypothetical protein
MCEVTSRAEPAGSVRSVPSDDVAVLLAAHAQSTATRDAAIIPRIDLDTLQPLIKNRDSDREVVASGCGGVAGGRGATYRHDLIHSRSIANGAYHTPAVIEKLNPRRAC